MTGLDGHVGFTYAKVLTIIRVKNFYAANCKKVPYRYLQGTSRVGNLLFFVTKSNKFRNNAVTFELIYRGATGIPCVSVTHSFLAISKIT